MSIIVLLGKMETFNNIFMSYLLEQESFTVPHNLIICQLEYQPALVNQALSINK